MIPATILMIFALLLFVWGCVLFPMSDVATVITTITAIVGAFAIWFQMKRERDIKEAEFIMSYNTSFIENDELGKLEQELENYRKIVESGKKVKEMPVIVREENRHAVINFLVYHEALATFVKNGVLNMSHIDDLFAYRFFLIMNNPDPINEIDNIVLNFYHSVFLKDVQSRLDNRKRSFKLVGKVF